MKTIKTKYYPVYIGESLLNSFDFSEFKASAFVVITDHVVNQHIGKLLTHNPSLKSTIVYQAVIAEGENSKSLATAQKLLRFLASHNLDRSTVILALGGGVIGDLAGFVASIYKRGVRYVQLPTTLLAQADSSHGGKTALNLPEGKNLIGTTYFPEAVVADLRVLSLLPPKELVSGLAEIIKHGVIWDKKIFVYLEKRINKLSIKDLAYLVERSAVAKAKITEKDPEETEFRKILNYGHTVGHALEIASGHKLTHGQAVALGMLCEGAIANQLGFLSNRDLARQDNLIRELGINPPQNFEVSKLIDYMRRDKKSKNGKLYFVMPTGIGKARLYKGQVAYQVEESVVSESLKIVAGR